MTIQVRPRFFPVIGALLFCWTSALADPPLAEIEWVKGSPSPEPSEAANYKVPERTVIQTRSDSSLRVRFEDKSVLVVGGNSELTLQSLQPGDIAVSLDHGKVRAIVSRPATPSAPKKHRFRVRTKDTVMGVRGTDFTVIAGTAETPFIVHTLEGSVEMAATEQELSHTPQQYLYAGEALTLNAEGESKKFQFDVTRYAQDLNSSDLAAPPSMRTEKSRLEQLTDFMWSALKNFCTWLIIWIKGLF